MPTIWGSIETIDDGAKGPRRIQIKTMVSFAQGCVMRVRAIVRTQTLIARGIQRVDLSNLRAGEFVELSYHDTSGRLEAETIYVRPDSVSIGSADSETGTPGLRGIHGEGKEDAGDLGIHRIGSIRLL